MEPYPSLTMVQVRQLNAAAATIEAAVGPVQHLSFCIGDVPVTRVGRAWQVG